MSPRNLSRISAAMVPELLESFPAPPSFIPPSPRTPFMPGQPFSNPPASPSIPSNPPPSLPPSGPLPPLPVGPSPITEEETLLFLSSASRLKRLSKLSINSTSSRRDSTATTTSVNSNGSTGGGCLPGLSPSMSGSSISSSSSSSTSSLARIRTESLTSSHSLRSYPSTSSLSVLSASAPHSHRHPVAAAAEKSIPVRLLPPMEISITEEEDSVSTSADLTAVTLDFLCSDMDEENCFPQFQAPTPSPQSSQPPRKSKQSSPPPSSFKSPPPVTTSLPPQPFPNKEGDSPRGRTSPDIQTIISETPKPRRRKSSLLSNSSSRDHSTTRAPPSNRQPQRSSAPSAMLAQTSSLRPSITRKFSLPEGRREGVSDAETDEIEVDRLERELEGDGTESDSSLDLHTPFAHVMLRDGLISPRSKVISALDSSKRPGSAVSTMSLRTKNGLFKDDRDTLKRRRRHRDGKLLRGGIGLTTGLGWSDSEDEDSPSPLTRRLSSMALSRTPSAASIRSQAAAGPSPLSPSRTHSTVSADGTWTRQSSVRSSNGSSSSTRLPPTREDEDTEPPPLPPKDNLTTQSLPTRRPQPTIPSTPGPRTLRAKPSLKSIPSTSEFGVMDPPPSSGPRPLKLTSSSSMLRSSSLGTSPGSRLVNGSSIPNPGTPPTGSLDSRNRTKSGPPSSVKVSPSPLLKNSKSLPRPVPLPSSSIPHVSSPFLEPTRQRSRIGTGMIYKRSGPTPPEFGIVSGLKKPTLTTGGLGVARSRGLGLPSPLRAGGSEGTSPSSSVEFGIAL